MHLFYDIKNIPLYSNDQHQQDMGYHVTKKERMKTKKLKKTGNLPNNEKIQYFFNLQEWYRSLYS